MDNSQIVQPDGASRLLPTWNCAKIEKGGKLLIVLILFLVLMCAEYSSQHYVPPQSVCMLAKLCNHTWLQECGREACNKHLKLFYDACDRHEYNCDYRTNYEKVDLSECNTTTTTEPTTTTTTTLTTTTELTTTTSTTTMTPTTTTTTTEPTTTTSTTTTTPTTTTEKTTTTSTTTTTPTTTTEPTTTTSTTTTTPTTTTEPTTTTITTTTTPTTTTEPTTTTSTTTTTPTTTTEPTTTTSTTTTTPTTTTDHKCNRTGRYKPIPYTELPTSETEQNKILNPDTVKIDDFTPNIESDKTILHSVTPMIPSDVTIITTPEVLTEAISTKNVSLAQAQTDPAITLDTEKDTSSAYVVKVSTEKNNSTQQAPEVPQNAVTRKIENVSHFLNVTITDSMSSNDTQKIITMASKHTPTLPQTIEQNIPSNLFDKVSNITDHQTTVEVIPTATLKTVATKIYDSNTTPKNSVTIKFISEVTANTTMETKIQNVTTALITTNKVEPTTTEKSTALIIPTTKYAKKLSTVTETTSQILNELVTRETSTFSTRSGKTSALTPKVDDKSNTSTAFEHISDVPMSTLTEAATITQKSNIIETLTPTNVGSDIFLGTTHTSHKNSELNVSETAATIVITVNLPKDSDNTLISSKIDTEKLSTVQTHTLENTSQIINQLIPTETPIFSDITEKNSGLTTIAKDSHYYNSEKSTVLGHGSELPLNEFTKTITTPEASNGIETSTPTNYISDILINKPNTSTSIITDETSYAIITDGYVTTDFSVEFPEASISTLVPIETNTGKLLTLSEIESEITNKLVSTKTKFVSNLTEETNTSKPKINTEESKSSEMATALEQATEVTSSTLTEAKIITEESNVIEASTSRNYVSDILPENLNTSITTDANSIDIGSEVRDEYVTTEISVDFTDESLNTLVAAKPNTGEFSTIIEIGSDITDELVPSETTIVLIPTEKIETLTPKINAGDLESLEISTALQQVSKQALSTLPENEIITKELNVNETSTNNVSKFLTNNSHMLTNAEMSVDLTTESISTLVPTKIQPEELSTVIEVASLITSNLILTETSIVPHLTEKYSSFTLKENREDSSNISKISSTLKQVPDLILSKFTKAETVTDKSNVIETSTQTNYASAAMTEKSYTSIITEKNSKTLTVPDITKKITIDITDESINTLVPIIINTQKLSTVTEITSHITDDLVPTETTAVLDVTEKYSTSTPNTYVNDMSNINNSLEISNTLEYGTQMMLSKITETDTIIEDLNVTETSIPISYVAEKLSEESQTSVMPYEYSKGSAETNDYVTMEKSLELTNEPTSTLLPTEEYIQELLSTVTEIASPTTKELVTITKSVVSNFTEQNSSLTPNTNTDRGTELTLSNLTKTETITEELNAIENSTQISYASDILPEIHTHHNFNTIVSEATNEYDMITEIPADLPKQSISAFTSSEINTDKLFTVSENALESKDEFTLTNTLNSIVDIEKLNVSEITFDLDQASGGTFSTIEMSIPTYTMSDMIQTSNSVSNVNELTAETNWLTGEVNIQTTEYESNQSGVTLNITGNLSTTHKQSDSDLSDKINTMNVSASEYKLAKSSNMYEISLAKEITTNVVSNASANTENSTNKLNEEIESNYIVSDTTIKSTKRETNSSISDIKIENVTISESTADKSITKELITLESITPTNFISKEDAVTEEVSEPTISQTLISYDMIYNASQELASFIHSDTDTTTRLETTYDLEESINPSLVMTDIITKISNISISVIEEYSTENTLSLMSKSESVTHFLNVSNTPTNTYSSEAVPVVDIKTDNTVDTQMELSNITKDLITSETSTLVLNSPTLDDETNVSITSNPISTENIPLDNPTNENWLINSLYTTFINNNETMTHFYGPYDIVSIAVENYHASNMTTEEINENVTKQLNTSIYFKADSISTSQQSDTIELTDIILNTTLDSTTNFINQEETTQFTNLINETFVEGSSNATVNNESYVTGSLPDFPNISQASDYLDIFNSSVTQVETNSSSYNNSSNFLLLNTTGTIPFTMATTETNMSDTFVGLNESFVVTSDINALNNTLLEVTTIMTPLETKIHIQTTKTQTKTPAIGATKTLAKGKGTTKRPPAKGPTKKGTTMKGGKGTTKKGVKGTTKKVGISPTKKGAKGPTKKGPTKKGGKGTTKKVGKGPTKKGKGTTKKGGKGPTKKGGKSPTKKGAKGSTKKGAKGSTKKGLKGPTKKGAKNPTKKGGKVSIKKEVKGLTKKGGKGPTKKGTTKKGGKGTTKKVVKGTTKKIVKGTTKKVLKGTTKKPAMITTMEKNIRKNAVIKTTVNTKETKTHKSRDTNLTLAKTMLVITIPTLSSNIVEISSNSTTELISNLSTMFDNKSNVLITATSPFSSSNESNLYEKSSSTNNLAADVIAATTYYPTIFNATNNISAISVATTKTDFANEISLDTINILYPSAAINTTLNNYLKIPTQSNEPTSTTETTATSLITFIPNSLTVSNIDIINEIVPNEPSATTKTGNMNASESSNFLTSSATALTDQFTSSNNLEITKKNQESNTKAEYTIVTNATAETVNSLTTPNTMDNINDIIPTQSVVTEKLDSLSEMVSRADNLLIHPEIISTILQVSTTNNLETSKESEKLTTTTEKIKTNVSFTPTDAVNLTYQVTTPIDVSISTLINQITTPMNEEISTLPESATMATDTLTTMTTTTLESKSYLRSWSGFGSALFNKGLILLEIMKPKSDFI